MAFGASGISIVADSLSAIKNAKVVPKRDERGITGGFDVEGEGEKFGNDKDEVDGIAKHVVQRFMVSAPRVCVPVLCVYVCVPVLCVCVCVCVCLNVCCEMLGLLCVGKLLRAYDAERYGARYASIHVSWRMHAPTR
jgi:hypothetical protein